MNNDFDDPEEFREKLLALSDEDTARVYKRLYPGTVIEKRGRLFVSLGVDTDWLSEEIKDKYDAQDYAGKYRIQKIVDKYAEQRPDHRDTFPQELEKIASLLKRLSGGEKADNER